MKANELMIGDWVNLAPGDCPVQNYVKVHAIDYDHQISKDYMCDIAFLSTGAIQYNYPMRSLKPIPLTPEILEKNGFEVYEQDFTSNTVYKFGWLDYMEFKEFNKYFDIGSKITKRHLGREITYIHPLMRIYFVHELQHALRLCGIEKEIEI